MMLGCNIGVCHRAIYVNCYYTLVIYIQLNDVAGEGKL